MQLVTVPVADLTPHPANYRVHSPEQLAALVESLRYHGQPKPVVITADQVILAGHGLVEAAKLAGWDSVECSVYTGEQPEAYIAADNKTAAMASDDPVKLAALLSDLADAGVAPAASGYSPDELAGLVALAEAQAAREDGTAAAKQTLAERFVVPPFTVLDARQGYWQERKRAWLALGIQSEVGRERTMETMVHLYTHRYDRPATPEAEVPAWVGTSIFDPVLCEIVYRWFCPEGGSILDPFAGGSVRGVVASALGRPYTGIELRPDQVEANLPQGESLCDDPRPRWVCGDARDVQTLAPGTYDLVFSCPPYADLEVYSDDPNDLSNMPYPDFVAAYRTCIAEAVAMLAPNRFACFVVGDVRDPQGLYRNFVSDTIAAFRDAGMALYNEAILLTSVATLAMRVGAQFQGYRKLGKAHQNVLVFYNGDPKALKAWGPVACGDVPTAADDEC